MWRNTKNKPYKKWRCSGSCQIESKKSINNSSKPSITAKILFKILVQMQTSSLENIKRKWRSRLCSPLWGITSWRISSWIKLHQHIANICIKSILRLFRSLDKKRSKREYIKFRKWLKNLELKCGKSEQLKQLLRRRNMLILSKVKKIEKLI